MSELKNEDLEIVTGGDNGDTDKEWAFYQSDVKPMYSVGDVVEVYDSKFWHTTTERGEIVAMRITQIQKRSGGMGWAPEYDVKIYKTNEIETGVRADDIES